MPFRTVLIARSTKATVINQNEYVTITGINKMYANNATAAIITEIIQNFFVGAFKFIILPLFMKLKN